MSNMLRGGCTRCKSAFGASIFKNNKREVINDGLKGSVTGEGAGIYSWDKGKERLYLFIPREAKQQNRTQGKNLLETAQCKSPG